MNVLGAHEAQERTQAPLQSNLIAMNSQAEEVKEWFRVIDDPEGQETGTKGCLDHDSDSDFQTL